MTSPGHMIICIGQEPEQVVGLSKPGNRYCSNSSRRRARANWNNEDAQVGDHGVAIHYPGTIPTILDLLPNSIERPGTR